MSSGPIAQPLSPYGNFNWVLLVELIVCGILALFFLFYFNRLFATLVSYGIRAYTWHRFRAYVNIEGLQISLLGGRVIFTGIRYHGQNETIIVHAGYITWRYWFLKVKEANIFLDNANVRKFDPTEEVSGEKEPCESKQRSVSSEERGTPDIRNDHPCRISAKVSGLEAFLYNRTPAYDAVVANFTGAATAKDTETEEEPQIPSKSKFENDESSDGRGPMALFGEKHLPAIQSLRKAATNNVAESRFAYSSDSPRDGNSPQENTLPTPPVFLKLFPIHFQCNKGAVVVGNENTKTVITAKFDNASGEFDASSAGPFDFFKQIIKFSVSHTVIQMRSNLDYKRLQKEAAALAKGLKNDNVGPTANRLRGWGRLRPHWKIWSYLQTHVLPFKKASAKSRASSTKDDSKSAHSESSQPDLIGRVQWLGLTRYLESQDDYQHEWDDVEYATVFTVADLPSVDVSFYWDVPGTVRSVSEAGHNFGQEVVNNINGCRPPDYGVEIVVHGGTMHYGPWHDRHRIILQSVFFPTTYKDAEAATPLSPGETRVFTQFKLYMLIDEEVKLRIPFRESSKDWKWKGRGQAHREAGQSRTKRNPLNFRRRGRQNEDHDLRPFGWLDVSIDSDSTINYTMDMFASEDGYSNTLRVDVHSTKISSSINHSMLWKSGRITVNADLPYPSKWKSLRRWVFDVTPSEVDLLLLRDHTFLINDLIIDWTSGPPPDYFTFIPYQYVLNLDFRKFRLFLNTNDFNIIDHPSDVEENNHLVLKVKGLVGDVLIPLDRYQPVTKDISFNAKASDLDLELRVPPQNTLHTFLHETDMAQLRSLNLTGNYNLFTEVGLGNTDTLNLDIFGSGLTLQAYGFFIRHFVKFKENYFGEDLHIKTSEEFEYLGRRALEDDRETNPGQPNKITNDLDTILTFGAENVDVDLPCYLYSAKDSVRVELTSFRADLRITNYYFDMMMNTSPLALEGRSSDQLSGTQVFIEDLNVCGHRLFGLPPTEPAYVSTWKIDVGDVSGDCSTTFMGNLISSIRSLMFTLDDVENTVPEESTVVIPDILFLNLRTGAIRLWLRVEQEAFLFNTPPITVELDDWARNGFSQRVQVKISEVVIACVNAEAASRSRSRDREIAETHAYVQTAVHVVILQRKAHFKDELHLQQSFVEEQDQRTRRVDFLLLPRAEVSSHVTKPRSPVYSAGMICPQLPAPIVSGTENRIVSMAQWPAVLPSSKMSLMQRERLNASSSTSIKGRRNSLDHRWSSSRSDSRSIRHRRGSNSDHPDRKKAPQALPSKSRTNSHGQRERLASPSSQTPAVAYSSPFAKPYYSLDVAEPDLSEVPELPEIENSMFDYADDMVEFNDVLAREFDDDTGRISLMITAEPGLRVYCTPEAVRAVANLAEAVQPKACEHILDEFQMFVTPESLAVNETDIQQAKAIDVSVRLPCARVRLVNRHNVAPDTGRATEKDQYDFAVDKLKFFVRSRTSVNKSDHTSRTTSTHATLGSMDISVKDRKIDFDRDDAAIQVNVDNILLWLVSAGQTSVNVSFKTMQSAMVGKKIEYFASLIHRTAMLADEFVVRFTSLSAMRRRRLGYLAYRLTMGGAELNQLPFLSRPLYVVRPHQDHLRNRTSWKIVSRLRYNLQKLPHDEQHDVEQQLLTLAPKRSEDIEKLLQASFKQWRHWDFSNVKESIAMRAIYGNFGGVEQLHPKHEVPTVIALKSANIRLLIDPGPNQTEIALDSLVVALSMSPPSAPSGLLPVGGVHHSEETIIHVSLRRVELLLNWELCELAEATKRLFQERAPLGPQTSFARPAELAEPSVTSMQTVQFVFKTDIGSISLQTINFKHVSTSDGMKLSVLSNAMSIEPKLSVSVLLHFDAVRTELSSRDRCKYRTNLTKPTIYLSYDSKVGHLNLSDAWRVAATSNVFSFDGHDDVSGLIGIIDAILRDEVAYIKGLIGAEKENEGGHKSDTDSSHRLHIPNVHLAVFLERYRANFALVPTIKYSVDGRGGRISATPDDSKDYAFDFDFDVLEQSHHLRGRAAGAVLDLSTLKIPPINGRVQLVVSEAEMAVAALTTIEKISIEAAALHGLFVTLTSSEVVDEIRVLRNDVSAVQRRVQQVFPPNLLRTGHSRVVVYDIHAALAGLAVVEHASTSSRASAPADLVLELNYLQVIAANKMVEDGPLLPFPEIHANLQQLGLNLSRTKHGNVEPCGNLAFAVTLKASSVKSHSGLELRHYEVRSKRFEVEVFAETAASIIDVINELQERIKDIDLSDIKRLGDLRPSGPAIIVEDVDASSQSTPIDSLDRWSASLLNTSYSLELAKVEVVWVVGKAVQGASKRDGEDLVLSVRRIELSKPKDNGAQLMIQDLHLQMVSANQDKSIRSLNSALLPEVVFNAAYDSTTADRKLAFHAAGKALDICLDSSFLVPASNIEQSISVAGRLFRASSAEWKSAPSPSGASRKSLFGNKRFSSVVVDADFAGAVVYLQGKRKSPGRQSMVDPQIGYGVPQHGRYGQFAEGEASTNVTLRSPGLALKVNFKDSGTEDPSLTVELKVSASSNTLHPSVVPIIMEMSQSVKQVVRDTGGKEAPPGPKPAPKSSDEQSLLTADPTAILGKTKLSVGLRICKQEFSLSCQPIARVSATARFEDIYVTVTTVRDSRHGNFFALSAAFNKLQTSVQHVYSRESTFSFDIDSIVLSLMNSRHLSGISGLSAIVKINPVKTQINAKQLQESLLFREIWIPPEIRQPSKASTNAQSASAQDYLVQRYQQVTCATAFPWNATVTFVELSVDLDLGQAIGRSTFVVSELWASSKKTSSSEQNLCVGVRNIRVDSTGRMSGFVDLSELNARTSISWPQENADARSTPLVQASVAIDEMRVKAAFDYQAFAIANITSFEFLMYNVRDESGNSAADRLVAILDGDKIHVFCTAVSAAQGVALYQAFNRLVQEKQAAYTQSLRDIERFLRRESTIVPTRFGPDVGSAPKREKKQMRMPFNLHTDVAVTLGSVCVGAFPSNFSDHQVFKIEMSATQARFAVTTADSKTIHSGLGMTLGQLSVLLAHAGTSSVPKSLSEIKVEDVVENALNAKGGIILRVPKIVASMQTWQAVASYHIDYIFKSSFEGKVDVGWNYSRISSIRNMFSTHSRALASRLGKPLPESAVKITHSPPRDRDRDAKSDQERESFTAVVNMPQSKYEYTALEPPIIETPQLRDMGEATPPLEWIGLHRDRLPHVIHQVVIVSLLEVAKEVEDAYSRILGSS